MQKIFQTLSGRNDVLLAFLLIAIVFMMILPLPTVLVDTLIAINLSLAAILLMAALYLKDVVALSAFPSILLLTTLFRLSLSITTTRLILLKADAGEIIDTFGNFVVQGNLVVGIVIFLILTIVNFLVITKGSERVAEVSARFSLDAMPGKQMSIDSDMRAGQIELDEAKRRRTKLEKESQLYGSMDGAMKFVKGDAIAGLIITAVNIIGGVIIGTSQHGMSAIDALDRYTILTIGDGLVAQIPALFISITAGFMVTRVSTEDSSDLGSDIAKQLNSEPRALMIAATIMVGFALIPGFPTFIFLLLAAIFGSVSFFAMRKTKSQSARKDSQQLSAFAPAIAPEGEAMMMPDEDMATEVEAAQDLAITITVPLIVDISSSVRSTLNPKKLDREVAKVRKALYFDLGVPFPGIKLRLNESLPEGEYRILVNEVPVARGAARSGYFIARETPPNLAMFNIPYEEGDSFLPNTPSFWVNNRHFEQATRAGIQTLTLTGMLSLHLAHVLKQHAAEFLGIQECMFLLKHMEGDFDELVREVNRAVPLISLADVLKRLVREDISIRDMRTILQAIVEWGQKEKDPLMLTEHIRMALSRYITHKYSAGQHIIPAYLIDKDIEDEVRGAIRQTSGASYLALSPDTHRQLITVMRSAIGDNLAHNGIAPVILVPMDIRRFFRKVIERDYADLAVLSFQELAPNANIQPLEKISLRGKVGTLPA
ncbi:type III secretion system export apparatus subunit SctV [Pseudovibrio ascidiaceicola]|uniref:type III secretion system export apparatus subunit SctV n=1 Tax=Pseudovibrio ascidiaceicola TaxID=285279 RepID=UPI0015F2D752|nr:type III secretion system export apparatus subunit SctV [Pseudovibrio ascidiaceicola]